MIPSHKYVAMLVTGSLHCFIGLAVLITGSLALTFAPGHIDNLWMTLIPGVWSLLVGVLGILAGIDKLADEKTRQYKTAYMVTAILSAVIFTASGSWVYTKIIHGDIEIIFFEYTFVNVERFYTISKIGITFICFEFVLAIVSSSICCCCSPIPPTPVVIIQQPSQHTIIASPGYVTPIPQLATNIEIPYRTFQNESTGTQPPPYTPNPNKDTPQ